MIIYSQPFKNKTRKPLYVNHREEGKSIFITTIKTEYDDFEPIVRPKTAKVQSSTNIKPLSGTELLEDNSALVYCKRAE
mgnify:CR=1 FL=1